MLHYCKRCGRVVSPNHDKDKNCDFCKSTIYPVPEKYWLDGLDFLITNESKELLREELVKTSPEFDQYLFDHRDEILAKQSADFNTKIAHGKQILENKNSIPKCPYCQSTNTKKITVTQRAVKTGLFGIFGAIDDAGKTYKCGNCGCKF